MADRLQDKFTASTDSLAAKHATWIDWWLVIGDWNRQIDHLTVYSDIIGPTDKETVAALILLDLPTAFDTVVPDTLLQILKNLFDFFVRALIWFASYTCTIVLYPYQSIHFDINYFKLWCSTRFCAVPAPTYTACTTLLDSLLTESSLYWLPFVCRRYPVISLIRLFMVLFSIGWPVTSFLNPSKTEFLLIGIRQQLRNLIVYPVLAERLTARCPFFTLLTPMQISSPSHSEY